TIAGRVTDLGLVPVVGARVRVIAGPSFPPDAITGLGGTFRMENLPEGRYDLLITSDAFQPARFGNVVVTRNQTVNVNIVLLR
ncbi:carboxypeptidase regulatory-like domain-containing protein, partial [Candidatus Sumerlaeota bacterium]|nr:carboxypeptidase regulatory-like domain-containing protein [Candidatus Sumerlaeota bacterium]